MSPFGSVSLLEEAAVSGAASVRFRFRSEMPRPGGPRADGGRWRGAARGLVRFLRQRRAPPAARLLLDLLTPDREER